MSSTYVTQVLIENTLAVNPATNFLNINTGEDSTLLESAIAMTIEYLSKGDFVSQLGEAFFSPILKIWFWLLYNLISPLLLIFFIVAFFVAQYYLIRMYIIVFKYLIGNIIKFYAWASNNQKIKDFLSVIYETD